MWNVAEPAPIAHVAAEMGISRATASKWVLAGSRHQRITPYTPRHKGKIERCNRILSEEFLYTRAWTSEDDRHAVLDVWNLHYNYHRPHGAAGGQPPATLVPIHVNNVLASYS